VGLRQLQERQALNNLLRQICSERDRLPQLNTTKIPILVKLSPDLTDSQLDNALEVILSNQMEGVIATNTTISREGLITPLAREEGGLSGKPLFERSLGMVEKIFLRTGGKLPIIGVGGISNASGVQRMMDAGAILVQIYTGLLYEGPGLVKRILQTLRT
jgi:dihydroorotate dehydrogenase